MKVQDDSKLLSGVPLLSHGNPDNDLESFCVLLVPAINLKAKCEFDVPAVLLFISYK
jgi:hypothetical protein